MTDHPVTPPPELVQQLRSEAPHGIRDAGVTRELHLITAAYRAGADHELEACCQWQDTFNYQNASNLLRAARRPKPPSLKELALASVKRFEESGEFFSDQMRELEFIRKALEQLDD